MYHRSPPLWVSVALLMFATGVVGTNALLLSPLVQTVGADLQASVGEVMRASSAYGLGVAASALVLAPLGDRLGAGRILRLALAILTAGFAASAFAPNLWALIAAQALCGIAGGAALPSIYTLAALIAPAGREARIMGAVLTGWTLSLVLGVSAAAWVTDLVGWRAVYGALAAIAGVIMVGSASLVRLSGPSDTVSSPRTALRVKGMGRGLIATLGLMLSFYVSYAFMGAHVTLTLELPTAKAGLIPLFYGLGFGATVLIDPLLDRIGRAYATAPVFAMIALSYLTMALLNQSYFTLLGLALLWGMSQHLGLNLVVARLTALDPRQRGAIMGLYSTTTYLCVFAAPFLGGALFAMAGLIGCLIFSALVALIEVLESWQYYRADRKRSVSRNAAQPVLPAST